MVSEIWWFENHEKTGKKQFRQPPKDYKDYEKATKNHELPENHQKTQFLPKEYKLSAIEEKRKLCSISYKSCVLASLFWDKTQITNAAKPKVFWEWDCIYVFTREPE